MYTVTDPQGICVVINISHYELHTGLPERCGSELDVERVCSLFGDKLHFNIHLMPDLSGTEIRDRLKSLIASEGAAMASHGCFVCFLMAHGTNEQVLGCDGVGQMVAELTSLLDSRACPVLADKPKVFFVHSARMPQENDNYDDETITPTSSSHLFNRFFLRDTDFIVCFANTQGSPVLDEPLRGSAFIQTLCSLLEAEHKRHHLDEIMTGVNRYLKSHPVQRNGRLYYYVPETVSSLTRKFFLNPELVSAVNDSD